MTYIKPHWSFWLICILALVWNLMGSVNFILQMSPASVAKYPDAAQELINSRPLWATIAFALAVFGGVLGAIILLLKKSLAYYLFIASFLGVLITNIHTFQMSISRNIWIGSVMSLIIAAFLMGYAKFSQKKNWVS